MERGQGLQGALEADGWSAVLRWWALLYCCLEGDADCCIAIDEYTCLPSDAYPYDPMSTRVEHWTFAVLVMPLWIASGTQRKNSSVHLVLKFRRMTPRARLRASINGRCNNITSHCICLIKCSKIKILKQFPEPAQAQMDKQKKTANVQTYLQRWGNLKKAVTQRRRMQLGKKECPEGFSWNGCRGTLELNSRIFITRVVKFSFSLTR